MKSKKSPTTAIAKCAMLAVVASTASFLIAADPAPAPTSVNAPSTGNDTKRPSLKMRTTNVATNEPPREVVSEQTVVTREIGTVEIPADRNMNNDARRTTVLTANEIKEDQVVIPLQRESVSISKRTVADGSVRLRKVVKTETVNQPVELRREMLILERVPEGSQVATASIPGAFQEGDILLPMTREEVVINKTVDTEQVLARVTVESSSRTINESVRSENIEVVDRGNAENVRVIGDLSKSTTPRTVPAGTNQVAYSSSR